MTEKSVLSSWSNKHRYTVPHISLYIATQALYLAVFSMQMLETPIKAYITVGLWIFLNLLLAAVDLATETNSKPKFESVFRAGLLTLLYPFYLLYLYLLFSRKGAALFTDWTRFSLPSNAVCLEITFLVISIISLLYSGSAYMLIVRESSPIIWYKPYVEKNARGTLIERVVQVVSSALQVEYGATTPGTTNRLPVIDKKDQRISRKKVGYPTFLYMPTPKTIIYNLPSTVLQQLSKIISLGIIYTYLEAYALISLAVLFVFNTAIGYKLLKLKMPDSMLSTSLSMVQASASRKYCQVLKPVQAKYRLFTEVSSILIVLVSASVLLSLPEPVQEKKIPIVSCMQNSTINRICSSWETNNSLVSIIMIVSIFSGLVSILHAYITMKQISRKMIVVPRIWNEKHKAYLDDNTYSGLDSKWRLATAFEVDARKESIINVLQDQTINMFKKSRSEGLTIPHARLQDGIILHKLAFDSVEDIEVLQTNDEKFQTFDILYGLRFTRYSVYIKDY